MCVVFFGVFAVSRFIGPRFPCRYVVWCVLIFFLPVRDVRLLISRFHLRNVALRVRVAVVSVRFPWLFSFCSRCGLLCCLCLLWLYVRRISGSLGVVVCVGILCCMWVVYAYLCGVGGSLSLLLGIGVFCCLHLLWFCECGLPG